MVPGTGSSLVRRMVRYLSGRLAGDARKFGTSWSRQEQSRRAPATTQLQGLRGLPRDGGATGRRVHDGFARKRTRSLRRRGFSTIGGRPKTNCDRKIRGYGRSVLSLRRRNQDDGG